MLPVWLCYIIPRPPYIKSGSGSTNDPAYVSLTRTTTTTRSCAYLLQSPVIPNKQPQFTTSTSITMAKAYMTVTTPPTTNNYFSSSTHSSPKSSPSLDINHLPDGSAAKTIHKKKSSTDLRDVYDRHGLITNRPRRSEF